MIPFLAMAAFFASTPGPLETARDHEDRPVLEKMAAEYSAAADQAPGNPEAQYRAALAGSFLAGVEIELHDRKAAHDTAERGIRFGERAVALKPDEAEYLRVLGTLYGQAVTDLMSGLRYGGKAKDAIDKAVQKAPNSSSVYLARGVGNLYVPAQLGGGPRAAIPDFRKAIELDPRNAEAYLFLGLSLRDEGQNAEARQAIAKSLELDPNRLWARQQLEKTPAK
jgi:tetratricopeptide (TPR) repeat protein